MSESQARAHAPVPPRRIDEIVHGERRTTAGTAPRRGRYVGTSAQVRLDLQSHDDLEVELDALGASPGSIRPRRSA